MTVEQVTYINDLEPTRPQSGDRISQGDDHIRNIKASLRQTFPNVTGEVLASHEEINHLIGVTEPLKDFIDSVNDSIVAGEARFDDNDNLLANGVISVDKGTGFSFENNGAYTGMYPVDANGNYQEASLGDEATPWRAAWFSGSVHSPAYFTEKVGADKYGLTIYARSIWNDGGGGLYFGGTHIYPGDDQAGRTDGMTNLGSWSGYTGHRFRNIALSGSVLGRSTFSDEMSVGVTVSDVISMFERVKDSASRASTVEDLRSSIVDTFGDLIEQMKKKQEVRVAEITSDYEEL